MITIYAQDAYHQYDKDGCPITTWNEKYCGWIINPEYENSVINWQPDANGITEFPRGATLEDFKALYPNAENYPNITVKWVFSNAGYEKTFNEKANHTADLTPSRSWGHLNYTKEEAIQSLGTYCHLHKYAEKVIIIYNTEIIWDAKIY